MRKNVELLLVENVEALGIVGDVVKVRTGYARNFLLPRGLATQPSDQLIKELAGKRAEAQRLLAEERKQREQLSSRLEGVEITLIRSCNDQGILYGAITQQDVSAALSEKGYGVKPRDVRITSAIKRVDNYDVHVKLDSDLDATIKLHVQADRKLDKAEEREEAPAQESTGDDRRGRRRDEEPEKQKKSALDMALEAAAAQDAKRKGGAAAGSDSKSDKGKADKGKGEKKAKAKG